MMSDNHKFLAHIIVKGIKESYEPIIRWLNQLIDHTEKITLLISKEGDKPRGMQFVHHIIKAGLVSKDHDVALKTCNLLQLLAQKYLKHDLLHYAWDWFISDQGGLQYVLNSMKRHPEITESAIKTIVEYSQLSSLELFTYHLQKLHANEKDFLLTIRGLLTPLSQDNIMKEEVIFISNFKVLTS